MILGADESLPRLPLVNIGIVESPARRSAEAVAMAEDIRAVLIGAAGSATADRPINGHRHSMTRARQITHPRIAADHNPD
jgi:hypothetical protein